MPGRRVEEEGRGAQGGLLRQRAIGCGGPASRGLRIWREASLRPAGPLSHQHRTNKPRSAFAMEAADAPALPPEMLYSVAEFLPRRSQLEFARASRGTFDLLAPLAFSCFGYLYGVRPVQLDQWQANGWLRHLRRVNFQISEADREEEVGAARRVVQHASRLRSVEIYFEEPESWPTLLRELPSTVRTLEVQDLAGTIGGTAGNAFDFSLPSVRRLRYSGSTRGLNLPVLRKLLGLCPELEELELDISTGDRFDVASFFGPALVPRIVGWTLHHDQLAFRKACAGALFRPRRITNSSLDVAAAAPETLLAISRLPSVLALELDGMESRHIIEIGLPLALRELELSELRVNACTVENGIGRLMESPHCNNEVLPVDMEAADVPEPPLPPEMLYRVAEFLPRRSQLEFARASRGTFDLVGPLLFRRLPTRWFGGMRVVQFDHWEENGWLEHLRHVELAVTDAEEWRLALRIFNVAPLLRSADVYIECDTAVATVLAAIPPSIRELSVTENYMDMPDIVPDGDTAVAELPGLRCLKYSTISIADNEPDMLMMIVDRSPHLEELHIDIGSDDAFDFADYLGLRILRKVIDMDFGYYRSGDLAIEPETMAAIARLPSVRTLSLRKLDSRMLVDFGLPPALEVLEVLELRLNAATVANGINRIVDLFSTRPDLRVFVDDLMFRENASTSEQAECERESEIWQRRLSRPASVRRSGNFMSHAVDDQQ
ncbi:hypothetical protein DFJ74DRAFT_772156 [Hyaloraphidium curvatum]|nr:hypothetical protein DFJ74DRAFT_772156 [Hyaloraphidium curvatum]